MNEQTRKYLLHGDEVEVLATLPIGFLVANILEGDNKEEVQGEPFFVEKVFDKAPTEKLDAVLVELQRQVTILTNEKNSLCKEIKEVKEFEGKRLERYRQFEQLKRLDDFLDGKITHYVEIEYSRLQIIPIGETKSDYGRDLKLLTLFGEAKGDLNWKLNRFSDGSGGYSTVIPCTSYEEAVECLKKEVDRRLEESKCATMNEIEAARKFGFKIPRQYVEAYRDKLLEAKKKEVDSIKKREETLLNEIQTLSASLQAS